MRAAADQGISRGRLRSSDLGRPTRSVYAANPPTALHERAAAFALALPDHVAFSHSTAAALWGLPLPRRLEDHTLLHVIGNTRHGAVERAGCQSHRGAENRRVVQHGGLALTSLADTWCDVGAFGRARCSVDDLVVLADAILGPPGVRAGELRADLLETLTSRVRPRGKRMLLAALDLARAGSASAMESRARLVFHWGGLPEPELNAEVSFEAGGWMLRSDFVWREQRVIAEYQGVHHADRRRLSDDVHRRYLATDEGWRYVEVFAEDVFQEFRRAQLLARLRVALGLRW